MEGDDAEPTRTASEDDLKEALKYAGYKTHKKNVKRLRDHVAYQTGDWATRAERMNTDPGLEPAREE